jgi:prepilin-type N-terminal cleavage/methylation domain-containing protein/prepilin-type processing-associated H-X9-DG protein
MNRSRSGFTLVELLVVIAIIGILVALLLPAVQAAREAGRRSSCQNNLKQLALAQHNRHDSRKYLPPGCTTDAGEFGAGGGWGSSWMVFSLPYIEQSPMYDKWQFTSANSGYVNANNRAMRDNVIFPAFRCPSTNLREFGEGVPTMIANYVGISGTFTGIILGPPSFNEARVDPAAGGGNSCCSGAGPASGGGTYFRGSKIKLADMTDGTSNIMIIGEHGSKFTTTDGSKRDWSASGLYGWSMGTNSNSPPNGGTITDNRQFNCTTIRYRINATTGWTTAGGLSTQSGDCGAGVCYDMGNNIPLNANHPGGCNIAMGDASVRFISQTTPLELLGRLATRDDGFVVSLD